ncbi:MAG TPA: hypothetical protein EYQ50_11525 [Verrucomicrobiales bacterium]|nr:hypothetical protein [Verrucomicrobiales bacterium]
MNPKSHENLKAIRFEGELLPDWAQLLDVAARLCPLPKSSSSWLVRLTNSAGTDDSRTVIEQCIVLRTSIQSHRNAAFTELQRTRHDAQPAQFLAAWMYALDTMIQVAQTLKTCSWIVEGLDESEPDDSDGGEITLRRI